MHHWKAFAFLIIAINFCPSAQAAFSPTSIGGLQLWLDASDLNGDGIANNPSDGTAVSSWVDKSGQTHNATQGTAINRPLVQNAQINGRSVVRFDGVFDLSTSDYLTTAGYRPSLSSGYSIFVVERYATLNDGSYVSTADPQTGADGDLIRLRNASGNPGLRVFSGSGFYDVLGMNGANTPAIVDITNSSISGGGAGSSTIYLNGSTLGSSSVTRSTITNHDMTIGIGGDPASGSPPYNGDIAEILIYDSVLSTVDRQSVEAYLTAEYLPEPTSGAVLLVFAAGFLRRNSFHS